MLFKASHYVEAEVRLEAEAATQAKVRGLVLLDLPVCLLTSPDEGKQVSLETVVIESMGSAGHSHYQSASVHQPPVSCQFGKTQYCKNICTQALARQSTHPTIDRVGRG